MIESLPVGKLRENCYLFICDDEKKGALIDPGANGEKIKRWLADKDVKIEYILLTHGHWDHIGAVEELRREYNAIVGIHADDTAMLESPELNLSMIWSTPISCQPADLIFQDGQTFKVGNCEFKVIHTPGHSSGSSCFLTSEALFAGDTLFFESVGRTDLPGGSEEQIKESITTKLFSLPEKTRVLPGHGPETTIGREKKHNLYLR